MDAAALVEELRLELGPVRERLLAHPYIASIEAGRTEPALLRTFACEQHAIISSDLRSVAHLVSRFETGFFYDVLEGEKSALVALARFAKAVGLTPKVLLEYEPLPGAHAYAAYMAWLSAYASAAEIAAAYLVNFEAWGENCGRMSRALQDHYGLSKDEVLFFDQFATPAPEFEDECLKVIGQGLETGVPPRLVRRAARLLQGYELLYWDTLAAELR